MTLVPAVRGALVDVLLVELLEAADLAWPGSRTGLGLGLEPGLGLEVGPGLGSGAGLGLERPISIEEVGLDLPLTPTPS